MHRLISKHTKPSLNEPVKPYFPCQWVLFLSLGGLATKLWAKSANCPSEAAEVQTPNTPPLSSPDHNSQLPHTHSHTHTQDESVSLTTEEPGNSLAFNTHSTAHMHPCEQTRTHQHIRPPLAVQESHWCDCIIDCPGYVFFFFLLKSI